MKDIIGKSLGINPLTEEEYNKINKIIPSREDYFRSQKGVLNNFYGKKHTEETKKILSEKHKGIKTRLGAFHTQEAKDKIRKKALGRIGPNKGKISNMKGKTHTDAAKEKISLSKLGKKRSEETKKKLSESFKKKEKTLCIHCNNMFDSVNFKRWHGDKCKYGI